MNTSAPGDTIVFNCGSPCFITLGGPLPAITHNLTINGGSLGNVIIDGADSYRVFFVDTGTVTLANLQIQNALAKGGNGGSPGGGGGGLGAGAGCSSTKPARWYLSATALLSITRPSEATAMPTWWEAEEAEDSSSRAGSGLPPGAVANSGAGGGGVLAPGSPGGAGNAANGGAGGNGGGAGGGGTFTSAGGPGGAGFKLNPAGSAGGSGNSLNGGLGGFGGFGGGGGGAGDCNPGNASAKGGFGGNGGFGGGGGGGGRCNFVVGQIGGNGGTGGPGGGAGAGGLGATGGHDGIGAAGGLLTSAVRGGGGGSGPNGGGGGGAGAGPAIFVRLGTLTTSNSTARDVTARGGVGGGDPTRTRRRPERHGGLDAGVQLRGQGERFDGSGARSQRVDEHWAAIYPDHSLPRG